MEQKDNKRRFSGEVVSDKADKTIVVRIDRATIHPVYAKRFVTSKKFQAHDEKNEARIGDTVVIEESRPRSKNKKWRLVEIKKK